MKDNQFVCPNCKGLVTVTTDTHGKTIVQGHTVVLDLPLAFQCRNGVINGG